MEWLLHLHVAVVRRREIKDWVTRRPVCLTPRQVLEIAGKAHRPDTWMRLPHPPEVPREQIVPKDPKNRGRGSPHRRHLPGDCGEISAWLVANAPPGAMYGSGEPPRQEPK